MKKMLNWVINEENFLVRRLDGESLVLDLKSGDYYTAGGTASRILELILQDASVEKILETLESEYPEVPGHTLRGDLQDFLTALRSRGLVRPLSA